MSRALYASVLAVAALAMPCFAQQRAVPGSEYPPGEGVFYRAPTGWVQVRHEGVLWLETEGQWKWHLGIGSEDYEIALPGEHAEVQLPDARPSFFVRGLYPPSGAVIVRLEIKENKREVEAGPAGWNDGLKFDKDDVVPVEVSRLGERRFIVTPSAALPAGEYVMLLAGIEGQKWIRIGAPFGIPPAVGASRRR